MEQERRKYKRIKKTMAVQIDDSYGMLIDLSKGGMRIIPDVLPKRFEGIRISFITESGEPVELTGNITRIVDKKEKDNTYELALYIPNIPANYAKYIDALEKDEHPSGIFQEAVREDLVKAVLEGKEEDLIPKTDAPEPRQAAPHEDLAGEIDHIPLEGIFEEDNQLNVMETNLPVEQESTPDETAAMPLDQVPLEPQPPAPEGVVNIPLEEELEAMQQQEAREESQMPVQEPGADQTIVMPANRLRYQPSETETDDDKKAAPQRMEVSFDEFLQKNPQITRTVTPPPMPKKPPPEDEASLDNAFNDESQAAAPGQSSTAPDDDPLDKIFSEQEQG